MIQIKHRYTGVVIHEVDSDTLCCADLHNADLSDADLSDADLHDAYLYGADLRGVDLRNTDLSDADLRGADLRGANLRGANLRGADLTGANLTNAGLTNADLRGTNLRGAKLNWQSHALLAEILKRNAGDNLARLMIAGLVGLKTDWCWREFLDLDLPEKTWALQTLADAASTNDPDVPHVVRNLMTSIVQASSASEVCG